MGVESAPGEGQHVLVRNPGPTRRQGKARISVPPKSVFEGAPVERPCRRRHRSQPDRDRRDVAELSGTRRIWSRTESRRSRPPWSGEYDVILMDIQMPRVNGLDAIRAHPRARRPRWRVPIVAVTAFAQESDRKEAMNAGADGYLTKPVRKTDLQAALDEVSRERGRSGLAGAGRSTKSVARRTARGPRRRELRPAARPSASRTFEERLAKLEAAQSPSDGKQIRALAHQLKGLFRAVRRHGGGRRTPPSTETCDDGAMAESVAVLQRSAAAALARFRGVTRREVLSRRECATRPGRPIAATALPSASRSFFRLNGFETKSSMPASRQACSSVTSSPPPSWRRFGPAPCPRASPGSGASPRDRPSRACGRP